MQEIKHSQEGPGTWTYFDMESYGRSILPEETATKLPTEDDLYLEMHTIGADPDRFYVRVTLTNFSNEEQLVVPIHPQHYQFELKLTDGSIVPLVTLPPTDYPMFTEAKLVRLYPKNSIYADFAISKIRRKQNASYRVSVQQNVRLQENGDPAIVRFRLASMWTLFK